MLHFGDITKISGFDAPVVDVIVGGSPCQDLSIAGKRAGLDGERSGLFMEQIRIIKEMRENDRRNGRAAHDVRPRYMVWENVPGAFSSNKGEDFRIVLEETAKVADKDAVVPMPDKGKWSNAGCIVGDGWSIAWRILDAQFWGVPQRRRRIALVADFGGQSAPEILFVRKGLSGNFEPSKPQRKETSHDASSGFGADDRDGSAYGFPLGFRPENVRVYEETGTTLCNGTRPGFTNGVIQAVTFEPGIASREGGHIYENVSGTIRSHAGDNQMAIAYSIENHPADRDGCGFYGYNGTLTGQVSATLGVNCGMTTGRNGVIEGKAYTLKIRSGCEGGGKGALIQTEKSATLSTLQDQTLFQPIVCECYSKSRRAQSATDCETWKESDTANTLNAFDVGEVRATELVVSREPAVAYAQLAYDKYEDADIGTTLRASGGNYGGGTENLVVAVDARNGTECETNGALQSNSAHSLNGNNVVRVRYIVRRLTPLECERLQGFPDGWTLIGEPKNKVVEVFDEDTGEKEGEHIEQEFYYTNSQGKRVKASDSARYKALGNSIAIPPWKWVMKRISACYERDATLASLFDGIGGFPYIWEQINGKGSCLWASEIEEFCIAVTKERIG